MVKIKIEFFSLIQDLAKRRHLEVILEKKVPKLLDLLNVITEEFGPQLGEAVFDANKRVLKPGILVAINGKSSYFLNGMETPLKDGDKVIIGVAFRGG